MGETTDRLSLAAMRGTGEEDPPKTPRILTHANVVWAIVVCILTLMFTVGRSTVTRDEVSRDYLRQDVYARDHEFTNKQLDTIEHKLDKIVEAVNARP